MKVDYEGQVYDLDLENFDLKQAMAIQGYTGMSIMKLFSQLKEVEEDTPELFLALGAIYWLMQNQAGNIYPIADTNFPVAKFTESLFRAMLADEPQPPTPEPEGEPGPTVPSPASSPSPPALLSPNPSPREVVPSLTVS